MTKNIWVDDVMRGAHDLWQWVQLVLAERGMLYGAVIYLMIRNNITVFELPNAAIRKSYGENYYIEFKPNEDGVECSVFLHERPDVEEEEENGEQTS